MNLKKDFRILKSRIKDILNSPTISEDKKFFVDYLPTSPIILEAGAHNGYDTVQMSHLWKKGEIYCFEPVPDVYHQLIKNTCHLKNVHCFPFALSHTTGTSEIFVSDNWSASSSLMKPKEHLKINPQVVFNRTLPIQVVNLDDWMQQYNIHHFDFMWLDMQGMEMQVLKSSPNALRKTRVIFTEVHIIETYEGVPMFNELKQWLTQQGFSVLREQIDYEDGGNVTFIKD